MSRIRVNQHGKVLHDSLLDLMVIISQSLSIESPGLISNSQMDQVSLPPKYNTELSLSTQNKPEFLELAVHEPPWEAHRGVGKTAMETSLYESINTASTVTKTCIVVYRGLRDRHINTDWAESGKTYPQE